MARGRANSSAADRIRRVEGRHNALAKQLRRSFTRSERTQTGECAIEGLRLVEEAIRSGLRFRAVFFRESARPLLDRLLPQISAHVETLVLPDPLFDSLVATETPQGVAALVRLKEFSLDDIMERLPLGPAIVAAGLQDPGNLGTILRSSEAFGSAGLVIGEGTVSPFNAKVVRSSAGSIFRFPVMLAESNGGLENVLAKLKQAGVRLIATSSHKGIAVDRASLIGPAAVLLGSEGAGLSRTLMACMDELIAIPHSEHVESLNAAIAGSIVLYEAARQRRTA